MPRSVEQRVALYLRTSTSEQHTDNQRPELERLASARGWTLAGVYEEQASAAKTRPVLKRLLADASRRAFDVLLVWSLDRLGRSMVGNVQLVLSLDQLGVRVASVREPWVEMQGPTRELLLAIFGWIAQQEREQLVARTRAGLDRARREGVRLGRPPTLGGVELLRARQLREAGQSWAQIASELRVSAGSVRRALAEKGAPAARPQARET